MSENESTKMRYVQAIGFIESGYNIKQIAKAMILSERTIERYQERWKAEKRQIADPSKVLTKS